ncbi:hypothetical protein [Aurantimonas sp. VKM B-3413]|uniref:hypothetical protein n=1 Tax=Aurantimonas sp. VKM B-3413 TaxID=2779401 RepID=UPI001E61E447|nr:hypothetical protein [Aurantimonas sp. VKM B-3413]MCB8838205.1 hypothetical protein [Aurantimonas sp. VKM B-3413]
MRNIDKIYASLGLAWLIGAAAFGTWLGASGHPNFAQSHAHIGLLGFVASVLFGLMHKAWPELRQSRLALPQLVVYEVGTVVLLTGKVMIDASGQPNLLLMTGAPIVIIGGAMFLWLFVKSPATAPATMLSPAE